MAIRAEEIDTTPGTVDIDRDRRLVLRHQRGDVEAFDELYRRYHARLVTFCVRRVGDRHTAEELAQEAFLKALRAMPQFAGERRFYPWMTVIAHRLCIDHHRRSARVEPSAEIDGGAVEADHDAVFASVDRDHLGRALDRLAPRHREILGLREQRGWSYQQIATHLDVPLTTVEALLHRARKALRREFLAVAGDEPGRRFGFALAGGGLLARLKGWLAATGPERWAPILGTAAAGTLVVGLAAGPFAHHGDGVTDSTTPSSGIDILRAAAASTPAPPTTSAAGPPATRRSSARPVPTDEPPTSIPPSVDFGVATWYPGPEGAAYVDSVIECMPIRVDLRPVANVGVDPVSTLHNAGVDPSALGPVLDPLAPLLPPSAEDCQ